MMKPVPAFTLKRIGCCASHHCSMALLVNRNALNFLQVQ